MTAENKPSVLRGPPYFNSVFNVAAWRDKGTQMYLGRRTVESEVLPAGVGIPDICDLVLSRGDGPEEVWWSPGDEVEVANPGVIGRVTGGDSTDSIILLEDPRADVDSRGRLRLGVTVVVQEIRPDGQTEFVPYPAISKEMDPGLTEKPEFEIIGGGRPGKNAIPVGPDVICRFDDCPPDKAENHRLHFFRKISGKNGDKWSEQVIDFSGNVPDFAEEKIGTACPPFYLGNEGGTRRYLLIVHGIKNDGGTVNYSLGLAEMMIDESDNIVINLPTEPILTRDHFDPGIRELHPEKRVVYCCGGEIKDDHLVLPVNVGDTETVVAVTNLPDWVPQSGPLPVAA